MKTRILKVAVLLPFWISGLLATAQTPVYPDEKEPLEQRVEDALSRMTLKEKINIIP